MMIQKTKSVERGHWSFIFWGWSLKAIGWREWRVGVFTPTEEPEVVAYYYVRLGIFEIRYFPPLIT